MRKLLSLVSALLLAPISQAIDYAQSVVSYNSGTGFATEFGTGLPFTLTSSALGEPSRVTPGEFGGPVDPFNPPYLREQVLSIGAGGHLIVQFENPIVNNPANFFGMDFLIYGNSGLVITNGDFSGGGITDGTMFGAANPNSTRVSVSADNVTYFTLSPSLAPAIDGYFPTDGAGNFGLAADPSAANEASLSGLGLPGLRSLYGGGAGGAGFDIDWVQDGGGNFANVDSVRYIRIDVLSGAAEIDGIVAVPEPSTLGLLALGALLLRRRK